jgi:hypothetical protein
MSITRRVYLSSSDNQSVSVQNSVMDVNLSAADLFSKPNEMMSVSLVRASIPDTITTPGLTTTRSRGVLNFATRKPEDTLQILAFGLGQYIGDWSETQQTIYYVTFNDFDNVNLGAFPPNNITNYNWTSNTTLLDIITHINSWLTTPVFELVNGEDGEIRRISTIEGDTSLYVNFLADRSSDHILKAFGCKSGTDFASAADMITGIGYSSATATPLNTPFQYNLPSANMNVFLRTNLGFDSFISYDDGQNANILASIPLVQSASVTGTHLQSSEAPTIGISSQINYVNFALSGSHKPITQDRIANIEIELVDKRGTPMGLGVADWDVVLEFKFVTSLG